jgi:TetR/AcrR family transcriptional regulator, transcriptional repressor for nem operon
MAETQHQSKTRFLDAALHVFRVKGYSATRIEDVCETAGLTKGSFFHHFKTKEDLALATVEHFGMLADTIFNGPFRAESDPVERLLGYVDFRIAMLQGELPEITCLAGTIVQEAYDTQPRIREACARCIGDHAAGVAQLIRDAMQHLELRAEWSAESLGLHTQAVLQGAFILAKAQGSTAVAVDSLKHLRRYLALLFTPTPVSQAKGRSS